VDPTLLDEQDLPSQVAPIFERVQEVLKHSYIKQNKLTDEYEVEEQIGTGSFSICRRCVHKVSRAEYAVKVSVFLLKLCLDLEITSLFFKFARLLTKLRETVMKRLTFCFDMVSIRIS
jgi:hypothetical protein